MTQQTTHWEFKWIWNSQQRKAKNKEMTMNDER